MADNEQRDIAPQSDIEHNEAPEPKRHHAPFELGKVGFAIIAMLVVLLVAWRIGYAPDSVYIGRDAGGFAGGSDYGGGSDSRRGFDGACDL